MSNSETIIGHGAWKYRVNASWGDLDASKYPVKDAHEMAIDRRGRIFLLTNETRNNVLIYNKDGQLLDAWGTQFPGAHGLTLFDENGEEVLFITDYEHHKVFKTSLDGKMIAEFAYPSDLGAYSSAEQFLPTETAVAPNGDVYIADGYGLDYILHYDAQGRLKNAFGGKGETPAHLDNAHGVALDLRDASRPALLVTSRVENTIKQYDLQGNWLQSFHFPGAYMCRPVVQGKEVYCAVLISKLPWDSRTGFVLILDEHNRAVAAPGGSDPALTGTSPDNPFYQTVQVFRHPHDVLVDGDKNLYVAQWNSGNIYPIRLERV